VLAPCRPKSGSSANLIVSRPTGIDQSVIGVVMGEVAGSMSRSDAGLFLSAGVTCEGSSMYYRPCVVGAPHFPVCVPWISVLGGFRYGRGSCGAPICPRVAQDCGALFGVRRAMRRAKSPAAVCP